MGHWQPIDSLSNVTNSSELLVVLFWTKCYAVLHQIKPGIFLKSTIRTGQSNFRIVLRGENLNYNSCTNLLLRKSQNLPFLAPEVQWALKVCPVCSIHVSFKFFEPCPYLACHVTTIENVYISSNAYYKL